MYVMYLLRFFRRKVRRGTPGSWWRMLRWSGRPPSRSSSPTRRSGLSWPAPLPPVPPDWSIMTTSANGNPKQPQNAPSSSKSASISIGNSTPATRVTSLWSRSTPWMTACPSCLTPRWSSTTGWTSCSRSSRGSLEISTAGSRCLTTSTCSL